MIKFKEFLESLYNSGNAMFYLYVGIAVVAVLLLIVVIISIIKEGKRKKDAKLAEAGNTSNQAQNEASVEQSTDVTPQETISLEPAVESPQVIEETPVVNQSAEPVVFEQANEVSEPVNTPVDSSSVNEDVYVTHDNAEPAGPTMEPITMEPIQEVPVVEQAPVMNVETPPVGEPVVQEAPVVFPTEVPVEQPNFVEPAMSGAVEQETAFDNEVKLTDAEINSLNGNIEVEPNPENQNIDFPKPKEEETIIQPQNNQVANNSSEQPPVMSPEEIRSRIDQLNK